MENNDYLEPLSGNDDIEPLTEEDGILLEYAVASKDKRFNNLRVSADGSGMTDNGFKDKPYIKVVKGGKPFKTCSAEDRARISIFHSAYVRHNHPKDEWELNKAERKRLVEYLNSEPEGEYRFKDGTIAKTCWQALIVSANNEGDLEGDLYIGPNTPIPDYNSGIASKITKEMDDYDKKNEIRKKYSK